MVTIPMKSKKPMSTSDLGRINQVSGQRTVQAMLQSQAASGQREARPSPGRSPGAPVQPVRPAARRRHPPASGTMLQKGQKISLSQLDPGLDLIEAGLGWDLGPGGRGYELDVEAFLLGPSGKVLGDDWFVFYNQPVSPDGAVRLMESKAPGTEPGDDEVIQVRLSRVNPGVTKIVLILTIHEALTHGYRFDGIDSAYVRIVSRSSGRELVRFQLTDYYSSVCSMMVGELYRYKEEWRFNPVGNGTADDLAGLCGRYGVNV